MRYAVVRDFFVAFFVLFMFIPTVHATDDVKHRELLSKHYRLEKPHGAGPFHAIMMVPGCSGFDAQFQKAFFDGVQSHVVKLGSVTLRVNYLAARNASSCCPHVTF